MSESDIPPPEHFDTAFLVASGTCPPHGTRLRVRVTRRAHLQWTVFRSDAASVRIPELDLEHPGGTSRFCELGQCLEEMRDSLETGLSMMGLDSGGAVAARATEVLDMFNAMLQGRVPFYVEIDDPASVSFIRGLDADVEQVPYKRTWEQDKELGLLPEPPSPAEQGTDLDALVQLLAGARRVLGFTGAGISTESGLPAFRNDAGTGGLAPLWQRVRPERFHLNVLRADAKARADYWRTHGAMRRLAQRAEPNAMHRLFAWLAAQGRLVGVVTQNIDGLHQRAMSAVDGAGGPAAAATDPAASAAASPGSVLELHGTLMQVRCVQCGLAAAEASVDELYDLGEAGHDPRCPRCGEPLLPACVPFGAPLDPLVLSAAKAWAAQCDVVLVAGTGLLVAPANTVPTAAMQHGARLALLNLGETPLDPWAAVRVPARCAQTAEEVLKRLQAQSGAPADVAPSAAVARPPAPA